MSRKDYRETAAILATVIDEHTRYELAEQFASMFKRDNANFSYQIFYAACGLNIDKSRDAGKR